MRGFVLLLLVSLVAQSAHAQAIDPLLEVHDGDPLLLAAAVDRMGDAAIVDRFGEPHSLSVRLLAVRAAVFLHAPEQAMPALAVLAAGRDPDLAPAAMRSLMSIARSTHRAAFDAHETDDGVLTDTRAALNRLAADDAARADLRRAAQTVLAMLAALDGVSASE